MACLLAVQQSAWAETYGYDAAGQLIEVVYDDRSSIHYRYDVNGNILEILLT